MQKKMSGRGSVAAIRVHNHCCLHALNTVSSSVVILTKGGYGMSQQEHGTQSEIPTGWKKDLSLKHIFAKPIDPRESPPPRRLSIVPFIKTED